MVVVSIGHLSNLNIGEKTLLMCMCIHKLDIIYVAYVYFAHEFFLKSLFGMDECGMRLSMINNYQTRDIEFFSSILDHFEVNSNVSSFRAIDQLLCFPIKCHRVLIYFNALNMPFSSHHLFCFSIFLLPLI